MAKISPYVKFPGQEHELDRSRSRAGAGKALESNVMESIESRTTKLTLLLGSRHEGDIILKNGGEFLSDRTPYGKKELLPFGSNFQN